MRFRALVAAFLIETEMLLMARRLTPLFLIGQRKNIYRFTGGPADRQMSELRGSRENARSDEALQWYVADFKLDANH